MRAAKPEFDAESADVVLGAICRRYGGNRRRVREHDLPTALAYAIHVDGISVPVALAGFDDQTETVVVQRRVDGRIQNFDSVDALRLFMARLLDDARSHLMMRA